MISATAPSTRGGDRWKEAMLRGDFAAAWKVAARIRRESRLAKHVGPRHFQRIWDGTPLAGKRVLVRCYHGLGDTIQFIRYAALLKALPAHVIVWAQPELLRLLAAMEGIDQLLPLHDGTPEVDYDVDVELMELPEIFGTTLETIPASIPYVKAPSAPRRGRGKLEVGLVWAGGDWDPERNLSSRALEALAGFGGVCWHALQRGEALSRWSRRWGPIAGIEPIEQLGAVMNALDLIISVDSMPAHLAGALGRPTWTLLKAHADWRWMRKRRDSPWYPTMRLFRQPNAGDWDAVIEEVISALSERREDPRSHRGGLEG